MGGNCKSISSKWLHDVHFHDIPNDANCVSSFQGIRENNRTSGGQSTVGGDPTGGTNEPSTTPAVGSRNIDTLRSLLVSSAKESAFRKVVQATMVRDRQHGPVLELNRISAGIKRQQVCSLSLKSDIHENEVKA